MGEETPRFSFLTKEQAQERHQVAKSLCNPLSSKGDLIKNSIIDKNRLILESNPRISDLIGLYIRLREYELTGASPTGQLAKEWISLVAYSCELILKEGEHKSAQSFILLREMYEDIYGKIRSLSKQKPRHIFKSLAFVIKNTLKEKGLNFSIEEVEIRLKSQYERHPEIKNSVKIKTLLPWLGETPEFGEIITGTGHHQDSNS